MEFHNPFRFSEKALDPKTCHSGSPFEVSTWSKRLTFNMIYVYVATPCLESNAVARLDKAYDVNIQ